ncbi:MAG: RNA polymerase sigma factor [Cyclobacteriaceae bacterium]
MIKVREGDLEKLGLLYERYKRPLFGFFFGMNKDQDLSEDLIQNTFFRIMKYRHLFRGDGEFKTWMFHIARNVRIDHFKKAKIKDRDSIENWDNKLGHSEHRSELFEQEETQQMLSMAMEMLPAEKREVLLLSKYEERKYKDIGEILGCSEGAVKVKVFRALQDLKNIYQQLERRM